MQKTTYIIGAGASSEASLPTGYQLKKRIVELLKSNFSNDFSFSSGNGNNEIYNAIQVHLQKEFVNLDITPYVHAANSLGDAMPQVRSIDDYLDKHNGNKYIELCGKLAIVNSILVAERGSLLYVDESNKYNKIDFSRLENTWYSNFMMLLIDNCSIEQLSERLKSIKFIIFNYDRCVEHFIFHSLINIYGVSKEEAADLVGKIEIYHPYGVVGNLPWQDIRSVKFGTDPDSNIILALAEQIKTFTEGTNPESSEIDLIRKNIHESDQLVFLGFAYHPLNMDLLFSSDLEKNSSGSVSIYGTAQGISGNDTRIIESLLDKSVRRSGRSITINNSLGCSGLFTEYWRSLALS